MAPLVRKSLQQVYAEHKSGKDRKTLQKVIRAFQLLQAKDFNDPDSFYVLAGWHGEPFRGPARDPDASSWWWGGYCNHGNVLFPTWHRAYLLRLENAMQRVSGYNDVMLPFWDECFEMNNQSDYTKAAHVIPEILTTKEFTYDSGFLPDGEKSTIDNPLFSYKLGRDTNFTSKTAWNPNAEKSNTRYSKPKGYQTVRFPLSGLVGTDTDKAFTEKWNAQFTGGDQQLTDILNANVANWLEGHIELDPNPPKKDPKSPPPALPDTFAVYERYKKCLDAPNYTVFTNTTSATQWIADHGNPNDPDSRELVVPLEAPHNAVHLAVGGFYQEGKYNANVAEYQNANGDMGDNETAGFDPIFFFHHCFIDYVLWTYQRKNALTKRGALKVIYDYAGTITDTEGSPVGLPPGTLLDMNTPLAPFRHATEDRYLTSHDVTDIESCGYTYGSGSLDMYIPSSPHDGLQPPSPTIPLGINAPSPSDRVVQWKRVRGINRAAIEGSFVIRTYALSADGTKRVEIGREPVLSRLNVRGCRNCQTHVEAKSVVALYRSVRDHLTDGQTGDVRYVVKVQTHGGIQSKVPLGLGEGVDSPALEDF